MAKARLDADRTAKPLTRIVSHPDRDHCVGPGSRLVRPEYEAENGARTPLDAPGPAKPERKPIDGDARLSVIVEQLERVAEAESSDGQWIGNMRDDALRELQVLGLIWRNGEYVKPTRRGEDLLALVEAAK